jgi:hypothetical protein
MRLSKKYAICLLLSFVLTGIMAMGAAPTDKPDKEPIDKIVFVHYPKENPGNAFGKPDGNAAIGSGTGTLSKSYSYSGIKWADPKAKAIEYYVNPAGSGVANEAKDAVTAVRASMATWDNACGPLGYVYKGTTTAVIVKDMDGQNVISWANISSEYPNAIAVTFVWYYRYNKSIVEVDTQMNNGTGFSWSYTAPNVSPDLSGKAVSVSSRYTDPSNSGVPSTYDIQNIMTHEAGHWLMLGDLYNTIKDSELTMYGYGAKGELKKDTLGYGDELGVEAVYGW